MPKPTNRFDSKNKSGEEDNLKKTQEWGKVKFVPKVRAKYDRGGGLSASAATPWTKFKQELVEKDREERHSNAVDMDSSEAKQVLKKREESYRRLLITEQSKQPTKWENFDGDDNDEQKVQKISTKRKTENPQWLKNIDTQNFDAKKLTFKQNNMFRKVLTKGVADMKGNLHDAVKSHKRNKELRRLKNKK